MSALDMGLPSSPRLWPRALVFCAIALWMVWGPVSAQLFGRRSPAAFDWKMFAYIGQDVCSVRYVRLEPDGTQVPLDRFALLGHADRASAPADVRRLKNVDAAAALGAKLCKKLDGGPDVRLYARCGTHGGWRDAASGEANLCAKSVRREAAP